MDGAPFVTVEVAIGKAWTAAAWREPTANRRDKAMALPQFAGAITAATHGRYTPQTGGVPIVSKGTVVGSVGASGLTEPGETDEEILNTALAQTLDLA